MKITLRPPCAECPFLKKSAPGWLGAETPEQVYRRVHSDGPFGYPCHMDAEAVMAADMNQTAQGLWREDPNSVEQCVGALLHASKTGKTYDDKWREAGRAAMKTLVKLDAILGIDFMKHHKKGE